METTQLVTGYKSLVGSIDLLFFNKILEMLFVKEKWFDGTQTKYNIDEDILVFKTVDKFKGQYVEMEDSYNDFLLQSVQSMAIVMKMLKSNL